MRQLFFVWAGKTVLKLFQKIIPYYGKDVILLKKAIAIKNDSLERFQTFFEKGRIVILHAPCGFGKTTLVN